MLDEKADSLLDVPVEQVDPCAGQPRRHFDSADLALLAASIDADGQAVPALVRVHPRKPNRFELIAGERRFRAIRDHCKQVKTLRCVLVADAAGDDARAFHLSFVENEHRSDLSPIERASAMKKLVDGGHSQTDVARMIGRTQAYVCDYLSLLRLHPAALSYMDPARPERKRLGLTAALAIVAAPRDRHLELAVYAISPGTRLVDVERRSEKLRAPDGLRQRTVRPNVARHSLIDRALALSTVLRRRFEPAGETERVFPAADRASIESAIECLEGLAKQIDTTLVRLRARLPAKRRKK